MLLEGGINKDGEMDKKNKDSVLRWRHIKDIPIDVGPRYFKCFSLEELESHVDRAGIIISFTTLGPGFRAVARARHNETLIIGYVEGFVRPSGQILHLDKMEVFKSMVKRAREEEPDIDFGGVSFAIGLVLGYRCLLHGIEKGCTTAEFLAIDDEGMCLFSLFCFALFLSLNLSLINLKKIIDERVST